VFDNAMLLALPDSGSRVMSIRCCMFVTPLSTSPTATSYS